MRNLALIWTLLALASPAVATAADAKWDCENLDSDAMDPTGWKAALAGPDSVKAGEAATYTFDVSILPDHVLYQERADVSLAEGAKDVTIGKPVWPATKRKFDKLLGKEVDYWDAASMKVTVPVTFTGKPGKRTLELTITNQACNPCLCLFPTPITLTKPVEVKKAVAEAPAATATPGELGYVTYRAAGDTKVELDGKAIGEWRGKTDLATPSGKHVVTFTGADGAIATRDFVVEPGARLVVVADLQKSLVRVEAARPLADATPVPTSSAAPLEIATPEPTPAPKKIAASSSAISSQDRMKELIETNFALALLVSFVGGVLISLTPCVYPMVPITVAVIGNQATKGNSSASQSRMRGFLLSLVYVAGITAVYATLGVVAAKSGNEFGFVMRNPIVLLGVAAVFLALAASMFGAFEIQLPTGLQTRLSSYQGSGTAGVFVTGLFAGVVAGPCTAPVLIGILLAISAGSVGAIGGFALMTSFSVGMGLLFIAIGTFSGLLSSMPRSGTWMVTVKYVFGAMLVGAALYFLSLALPPSSQWIFAMAVGASLVMAGMALGAMMRLETGAPLSERMRQGLGWVAAVIGVWFLLGGLATSGYGPKWLPAGGMAGGASGVVLASHKPEPPWITDESLGVKSSVATGKPMVIDFWAEDCRACKELDEYTYSDARVIDVMKSEFVPVKIDLSTPLGTPRERKDLIEALKKKYKVAGLPKVVFIRPDGTEIDKELTLYGFEPADAFLERMDAARGCAPDATTC